MFLTIVCQTLIGTINPSITTTRYNFRCRYKAKKAVRVDNTLLYSRYLTQDPIKITDESFKYLRLVLCK